MADQSLLITLANRNYDGIDVEGFASKRGLRVVRLDSYGTDLQEMYDAHLLAEEPALVVGTGDVSFDGELAAALGIPVVLVTAEDANVELAERRLEELGAIVAGVFSAEQLADAEIAAVEARQVMSPVVFESWLIERAKEKRAHIVLPEGGDDRILRAASTLLQRGVAEFAHLAGRIAAITDRVEATLIHGLSNALVESTNTKIRLITRLAYGFHSPRPLIALAMLSLGPHRPALPGRNPRT